MGFFAPHGPFGLGYELIKSPVSDREVGSRKGEHGMEARGKAKG
jgi:hypothetical protein